MSGRRAVLGAMLAAAAAGAMAWTASAHTPYRQWVVYRQRHLLIGSHRKALATYDHARRLVATLEVELPEARARVARAPHPQRIASLIITGQMMVAVLPKEQAALMAGALDPFEAYEPAPLRRLADLDDAHGLYAHAEFPVDHARMVVDALRHGGALTAPTETAADAPPLHPGAAAAWLRAPTPG